MKESTVLIKATMIVGRAVKFDNGGRGTSVDRDDVKLRKGKHQSCVNVDSIHVQAWRVDPLMCKGGTKKNVIA